MVVHRPVLKQKHKPFKGGKGGASVKPKKVIATNSKEVTLHRKDKKNRIVAKTKDARNSIYEEAPRLVFIVPFHQRANVVEFIKAAANVCSKDSSTPYQDHGGGWMTVGPLLVPSSMLRDGIARRVVLFTCPRVLSDILYCASVADILVCLYSGSTPDEPAYDDFGYKALSVIRQQGVPTPVGIDLEVGLPGERAQSANLVKRYFHDELGDDKKFVSISSPKDLENAVTIIGGVSINQLSWRNGRGYLLSLGVEYDQAAQELSVVGYARGVGFSIHHPVHVTGVGDFLLQRVEILADAYPVKKSRSMLADFTVEEMTEHVARDLAAEADSLYNPAKKMKESLDEEEMFEEFEKHVRIGGDADDDVGMESDAEDVDDEDLGDVNEYLANLVDDDPKKKRIEFEKRALEDLSFPDEVDTPVDIPARERFHKYRALRCIKEGVWDPYESLPDEYLQICEFENFRTTMLQSRRSVKSNCEATKTSAQFVRLKLINFPVDLFSKIVKGCSIDGTVTTNRPLILSVVFPFERKVSVIGMNVTRSFEGADSIASKKDVALYCGFRRFLAKPIYSQDVAVERGRFGTFCRFVHKGHTVTASIYGMSLLPNTPVVGIDAEDPLVMLYGGSVNGADPTRIILKRIVLTGYPFKVHKRMAVVRYMFFNPKDIKYFKPAQLHTKRGLRGVIREPLGTHGYMKCLFNDSIRQDDIVCLALFKRVYPKWFPASWSTWLT